MKDLTSRQADLTLFFVAFFWEQALLSPRWHLKYTSTTHAAIILSMEAVIGSLFGMMFLNEKYSVVTIIGFAVIFSAVLIAETGYDWLLNIIRKFFRK